ncbi:helix-turn-helix transcriptional regulator [Cohnella sp. 56]|uniref:helix-turn-helix transcriptional regulator n=1 Tax=Cohnella sp. 56 TaxID=3113722 RepID=UPI0030EA82C0
MRVFELTSPPLPYYIASGSARFHPGDRHRSRQHIRVFDLLYVLSGCLFIGEDQTHYELRPGQALILSPDRHHFGVKDCETLTRYHWLHFRTTGERRLAEDDGAPRPEPAPGTRPQSSEFDTLPFTLRLPQYTTLSQPAAMEESFAELNSLSPSAHLSSTPLRQQILFQEILGLLIGSLERERLTPHAHCAERAASFLRTHYREPITAAMLGARLNFHPVYIARCMKRKYGCSPMEYLIRYRIEQSKLLLMESAYTVTRIASEVGFRNATYFSSAFARLEGVSPRQYRGQFS